MAFSNNYKLNVDLKRRLTSVVPTFKQGDSGRIEFTIYDDGNLFDLSTYTYSEMVFRLPSGQTLVGNPSLEDNKIIYLFTGTEMAEVGKVETVLTINSGATAVSIQPFNIFIFDSLKSEDLSYIGILQELIKEVQDLSLSINTITAQLQETLQLADDKIEELNTLMQSLSESESEREISENNRVNAEDSRVIAENTRVLNESTRNDNENTRISNEIIRQSQELERESSENTRIENELARENKASELNTLLDNFTSVNYSGSVTYNFPNLVAYNGSTYIALKSVVAITPNNDGVNWRLAAQRGVDGSGSVSSVNGVLPDENGNVEIQAGGGDGSVIISSTQPSEQQTGGLWLRTY